MNSVMKIGIIGAGIQGISNALFLQKKGFQVTIFDRDEPGSPAASYGNAGHFSPYASLSLNRTDILTDVPSMLLSSSGPLALKWNYVPKMIPWFIKFILNTSKTTADTNVYMGRSLLQNLSKYIDDVLTLNGDIDEKIFNLEDDVDDLIEEQEALDLQIANQRALYVEKFTAMETAVSSFKKTGEFLDNLIKSWNSNN